MKNLLNTGKKVIAVMHQKLEHPLAHEFRKKSSSFDQHQSEKREGLIEILLDRLSP